MIEKVTAVIADVDGTLNVKGTTPMPRTLDALERLHERGVLFGTASGRPLDHRALDKAHDWGLSFEFDLAIGMNGGDLWDRFHEGIEHIMLLKKEYIAEICEFMWPLDCNVIVYENAYDHVLVKRFDEMQLASMERNSSHPEKATIAQMALKDTGKIECQYRPELDDEIMAVVNAHPSPYWDSVRTFAAAWSSSRQASTRASPCAASPSATTSPSTRSWPSVTWTTTSPCSRPRAGASAWPTAATRRRPSPTPSPSTPCSRTAWAATWRPTSCNEGTTRA